MNPGLYIHLLMMVRGANFPPIIAWKVSSSKPVSNAAVEGDGTSGLVIEVFDDSDEVGVDVVLLLGCPQSCMPNTVEGLHEVYEDMVEVLLVLKIFITEDS